MTDIVLTPVTTGYNISNINANFTKIADSINNDVLHQGGGSNVLTQDLDFNGNAALNMRLGGLAAPVNSNDAVRLIDLQGEATIRSVTDNGLQSQITNLTINQTSGVIGYATLALLNADLSKPDGAVALVTNDATTANNTTYRKSGAAGTGSWIVAVDRITNVQNNLTSYSASLAASTGSASVGFINTGTGVVSRTLQDKGRDTVSLKDFGAVGNGTTDDTVAIQAAVVACVASGKTLLVPAGKYRTTTVISVGGKLNIVGEGTSVDRGAGVPGLGSWFFLNHSGQGFFLVTTQQGGQFEKIGTYRAHAAPGVGWTPTVYDYDFFMSPSANEWTFKDMMLLNPYKGIKCSNRPTITNVKMHAFIEGICIDDCRDTARLTDVHMWPFWSEDNNVTLYTLANLKAYRFLRVDNPTMTSCFCIYANKGLSIEQGATGTTYALRANNLNFDGVVSGIVVDSAANGATANISDVIAQNSYDRVSVGVGVQIAAPNCNITIAGYSGYDFPQGLARVDGAGCTLIISGMNMYNWDRASAGNAAVFCATTSQCSVSDYSATNTFSTVALKFGGNVKTKHGVLVVGPVNVDSQADFRHAGQSVIMTAGHFFYLPGLVSGTGNLPNGTEITIINLLGSGGNVTVSAVASVTLARAGVSANVTLTPGTAVRVIKVSDNGWLAL